MEKLYITTGFTYACMHRDYQSNTPIRLYQFDDRIEIMNTGGLYGEARPENFPHVNAYRNPIVAEAMKVMKYVNMFNRGISRVQEYLQANGSRPAQFNVDKLTVFEVVVTDANATALERTSDELRTKLALLDDDLSNRVKSLVYNVDYGVYSSRELQLLMNSARTPHELRTNSARYFMVQILKPAIELGLITPPLSGRTPSSQTKI